MIIWQTLTRCKQSIDFLFLIESNYEHSLQCYKTSNNSIRLIWPSITRIMYKMKYQNEKVGVQILLTAGQTPKKMSPLFSWEYTKRCSVICTHLKWDNQVNWTWFFHRIFPFTLASILLYFPCTVSKNQFSNR